MIDADTSRHYQPLESIKRVIDSMSFAKLVSSLPHCQDTYSENRVSYIYTWALHCCTRPTKINSSTKC